MYLDETWVNAHNGKNKAWGEKDTTTEGTIRGVRFDIIMCLFYLSLKLCYGKPPGKGERLIILHAGGKDGWVSGKRMH